MTYEVSSESKCFYCKTPDICCLIKEIPHGRVFQNLANGKLYAPVHDSGYCGGLMPVTISKKTKKPWVGVKEGKK
jgi:hypothetical protein